MHTHEEIVGVRVGAANLEEFHEVVELTMDISANGHRAFLRGSAWSRRHQRASMAGITYDGLYVGLFLENLACLETGGNHVNSLPSMRAHATPPASAARGPGLGEKVTARKDDGKKRTFSHSLWTSTSASCLQVIRLSIQPSRVGMVAGSALDDIGSAGARPTSSMFVSILGIRRLRRRSECVGIELFVVVGVEASGSNDVVALRARRGSLSVQNWAGGQVGGGASVSWNCLSETCSKESTAPWGFSSLFQVIKCRDAAGTCKGYKLIAVSTGSSWM